MNPEKFARHLVRPLALAILPFYAACSSGENVHISATETAVVVPIATPTATPVATPEQNVNGANRAPSKEEVIAMAQSMNMGAVFVSVRWQEKNPVSLRFSRLDVEDKKKGDDEALIILNKKIPNEDGIARAAFFATSCDGLYSVELSPDGGKTTFMYYVKLNPQTCTLDLDISLGKKGQLA